MSVKFELLYRNDEFIAKLAETLLVDTTQAKYLAEMFCTGRVKNVSKIYKTTVGLLSKLKIKTSFTLIEGAKGSFLYIGSFSFMNKAQVMGAGVKATDEDLKTFFKGFKKIAAKFSFTTGEFKLKEYKKDTNEAVMSILKIKGTQGKEGLAGVLNATDEFADKNKTKFRVFTPPVADVATEGTKEDAANPSDTASTSTDTEAPSADVAALKVSIKKIVATYKEFSITEMANVKSEKTAKSIMIAWDRGQAISGELSNWVTSATDNTELAKEMQTAQKVDTVLQKMLTQLKGHVDKIKAKQGEKSNADLDTISVDISSKINDLLNNFTAEIEGIPGLKAALDAVA